jgi:hypothetical protein
VSIFASDFNGDGNVDVVGAGEPDFGGGITWLKNDGSAGFTATEVNSATTEDLHADDIDGDGDTDVIGASFRNDKISWYENTEGVLPVELADLSARANEQQVVLTWTTASETNNAGFSVQHKSPDGASWTELGFVESTATGGTTTEAQSYRFTAENLSVGTHQFRLRQKDLDGATRVHGPVRVELRLEQPVRLTAPAPNPVQDQATLSFAVKKSVETTLRLYNVLGRRVATLYQGTPAAGESTTVELPAADLPSGTYFLRLEAGPRILTERLTVVR